MSGYRLTGRGWLLIIVLAALLSTGAYALVSSFDGTPEDPGPSGPHLEDPTPAIPSPPDTVDSPPDILHNPSPDPSPLPSPILDPSPPEASPVIVPSPSQPPPVVNPSPKPSPIPTPAEPPKESPSPAPHWASLTDSVMFNFDSAEPSEDHDRILAALSALIPPADQLSDYIIVVAAYTSEDEAAEGLAQQRADVVADIIVQELGIPAAMVRTEPSRKSDGVQSYRQRADIYFLYVGNK